MTQTPTPKTKPIIGTHDLGEIVGFSYRIYFSSIAMLLMLALLTVPLQLLSGAVESTVSKEDAITVSYAFLIPSSLVGAIVTAAVVYATHQMALGSRPQFASSLDAAFDRLWPLIGTALLAGVCCAASLLAAPFLGIWWLWSRNRVTEESRNRRKWWMVCIPGALALHLLIRWAFAPQAVMIQERRNWSALDTSADAVLGSWWRTFGILAMLTIISLGPLIAASPATRLDPLPAAAILGVAQAITLPFYAIGQTLLYYDLKTRTMPAIPVERPTEELPA